MWAYGPNNAKIADFCYIFGQEGYIPFSDFLQNLAWRRESQVPTITPTFSIVAVKMWAYGRQNRQK